MTSPLIRATTLKQAFQSCDVGSLQKEYLDRYYVDLSAVRSMEAIKGVSTRLDFMEPGRGTVLFTGHRGCGKSTELRRLQRHWETNYRVIYLEADDELDITDADYTDLYLVLIKHVADVLARLKLGFDPILLGQFQAWFMEITAETEESVEKSVSLETTAQAGLDIPFISKLMAKLLAQIKGSNVQKKIRQTLQQTAPSSTPFPSRSLALTRI
jgi:energy-coupling factor transporter ATP-binding protein EcfA2